MNRGATTRNGIAKTPTTGDGTVNGSWDPDVGNPGSSVFSVDAIAVSGGDVFFGGDFTTVNGGTARNRIAKTPTTGDGTVGASWDPNANNAVRAISVSGTEVFFGGNFTIVNGPTARNRIAKTPKTGDGTVDEGWNPNASGNVAAIAVSGGNVYAGGDFASAGPGLMARNRIARLQRDGAVDPTWDPDVGGIPVDWPFVVSVRAIAVSGTDVFFGGDFTKVKSSTLSPVPRNRIAKTSTTGDGKVDEWDPNANAAVYAIGVWRTDVFLGGNFTTVGGRTRNHIAAICTEANCDGQETPAGRATGWDPNAKDGQVYAIAVSGTDVFFGGYFTKVNGSTIANRNRTAKTPTAGDGTVDPEWDPDVDNSVRAIAVSGADVFFGGDFTKVNGSTIANRNRIAKTPTTGDGTVDPEWDPDVDNSVRAIAVSGADVFFGGDFTKVNGSTPRNRLAAVCAVADCDSQETPAGRATGWDPNANFTVHAIAVSGADVFVGGSFSEVDGHTAQGVAQVAASTAVFQVDHSGKDFGNQDVSQGATATQTFTVQNTGTGAFTNTRVDVTGSDPAQFAKSDDLCQGNTLAPLETCTLNVAFDPDSAGAKTASLTFEDNAEGSPHKVSLKGTGVEPAVILPEPPAPGSAPEPVPVSPAPPLAGPVSIAAEAIVARGKIAVGKSGAFAVEVACPALRSEACHGKIIALARASARKRKLVTVGSASYSVPPGAKAKVVIKLSKAGLRLMHKARPAGRLTITLTATSSIAANQAIAPARAVLTLRGKSKGGG